MLKNLFTPTLQMSDYSAHFQIAWSHLVSLHRLTAQHILTLLQTRLDPQVTQELPGFFIKTEPHSRVFCTQHKE
jgi:hypothetical protein